MAVRPRPPSFCLLSATLLVPFRWPKLTTLSGGCYALIIDTRRPLMMNHL